MKKSISFALAVVLVMSLQLPILAADNEYTETEPPDDYGEAISTVVYYDYEAEATVTEKTYFVPDTSNESNHLLFNLRAKGKSGRGWYKNTKTYDWSNGDRDSEYSAQGYFVWGNGDVSVSSPSGWYDWMPATINEQETTSGTGNYAYIGNKYAYVKYHLNVTGYGGVKHDFNVTIKVSENGNPSS